ncbi:acyl-homoserine-lactone synthase [Halorhodospira neutriphila]|uniref:PEP-CTERM/exosortase system-associated acyltransferase n=1 Tax=Halorhodospira neutriphila TaxID=168379 RepID=A0ABS1E4E3_9GAMM|nr:GNAT family N-acyltransferase [Halorhodospira neutriphila]MBK1726606.1 hypothetical protein [Halorhodospira neutriphila]
MTRPRYQVILADHETPLCIHFQLRFQVFCEREGFEPRHRFPDGMEQDHHDEKAVHFLLLRHDGPARSRWVGTLRLIRRTSAPLPLEEACGLDNGSALGPDCAELSRLIINDPSPRGENIPLYLFCQAAHDHAARHGINQLYLLVRPALGRLLHQQALPLVQAGAACQHRGLRVPYRVATPLMRQGLDRWRESLPLNEADQTAYLPYTAYRRQAEQRPAAPPKRRAVPRIHTPRPPSPSQPPTSTPGPSPEDSPRERSNTAGAA